MVIYIRLPSSALSGIIMNWLYGINNPITAEIKGILNVLFSTGIFCGSILPPIIWHCGTVGDINGYLTPFANWGEYRFVNPVNPAWFCIVYEEDVCPT